MLVVAECMMILTVRVTDACIADFRPQQQAEWLNKATNERKPCWDVDEEEDDHNASPEENLSE